MLYWNFNILTYCILNVACSRHSSGEVGGHPRPYVSPMDTQPQSLYPQQGDQAPPLQTSESSCLVLSSTWSSRVQALCLVHKHQVCLWGVPMLCMEGSSSHLHWRTMFHSKLYVLQFVFPFCYWGKIAFISVLSLHYSLLKVTMKRPFFCISGTNVRFLLTINRYRGMNLLNKCVCLALINTVSSFSNGFIYLHTQHEGVTGVPHPHLYSLFLVFLILEFKWEQNSRMINYCGLILEYIFLLLLAILVLSFVKYLSITFSHLKTGLLYQSFLNDLKNIFWIWVFCYLHVLQSSSSTPTLQHIFLIILDEEKILRSLIAQIFLIVFM